MDSLSVTYILILFFPDLSPRSGVSCSQ